VIKVGILAIQGDVREHALMLAAAGTAPMEVRHRHQLEDVDALVVPGGESTTIGKLLDRFELLEPLRERISGGLPVYGTCAGLILLADEVVGKDEAPLRIGGLDLTVRRNAYGRQVDSFEADLRVKGLTDPVHAAFIRAPVVERAGQDVEVLASWEERPVLVRQRNMLASTFHPEVTGDDRIHRMFVETYVEALKEGA
jgi:pyridoxal 5'-phosphate synthase pdxT subunit